MEQDKASIDLYTLAHYLYGRIARQMGYSMDTIMLGAILYEFIEPAIITYMRESLGMNVWGHESRSNVIIDVIASYLGARR